MQGMKAIEQKVFGTFTNQLNHPEVELSIMDYKQTEI